MVNAFYNEFDHNAAEWMRNLAQAGEISQGVFDERSIKEITGADLAGIRRAHFFAGIGGWELALRLAGWPEDKEVWTGSCPCQPFSSAGKGKCVADERHLWPDFFRLIAQRRPGTVFGEQVVSAKGLAWLDGVFGDLEGAGYTCGAAVVGAHSVGAPHIRQRIYWVAHHHHHHRRPAGHGEEEAPWGEVGLRSRDVLRDGRALDGLGEDPASLGRLGRRDGDTAGNDGEVQTEGLRAVGGVGDDELARRSKAGGGRPLDAGRESEPGCVSSPWSDYRIIPCTDGKARRTGARVFPLAYGIPRGVGDISPRLRSLARSASRARVGMLKGSGNAIVPELAAEFVRAFMEII